MPDTELACNHRRIYTIAAPSMIKKYFKIRHLFNITTKKKKILQTIPIQNVLKYDLSSGFRMNLPYRLPIKYNYCTDIIRLIKQTNVFKTNQI